MIDALLAERERERKRPAGKREEHARRSRLARLPEALIKLADAVETAAGRRLPRLPARLYRFATRLEAEFGPLLPSLNGEPLWAVLRALAHDLEAGKATPGERHEIAEELRRAGTFLKWLIPRYREHEGRARAIENAIARHVGPSELAGLDDDEWAVRARLARRWRDLAAELLGERR